MKIDIVDRYGDTQPLWYEITLPKKIVKYLWELVDEGEKVSKEQIKKQKGSLVGNISTSFPLEDKNNFFSKQILNNCIKKWVSDHKRHPTFCHPIDKDNPLKAELTTFWGNYQYKGEFNPPHHHTGVYSFVIWLKIPYNHKKESLQPWLDGIKPFDRKVGCFEFNYPSHEGNRNFTYFLNEKYNGKMLFFPSWLQHQVHPFFTSDEKRVSLSGNITLK